MDLINRIDRWLTTERVRDPNKRWTHHPSSLGACVRQLWYKWNHEPATDPTDACGYYKMKMGNYSEKLIEDWLKHEQEHGWIESFESQVDVRGEVDGLEHKFHGYIDFVYTQDEQRVGLEIKTSFGQGIKAIQRDGMPKEEHLAQVYAYMLFTKIKRFYIVYVARDSGYRTQFEVVVHGPERISVNDIAVRVDWSGYIDKLKKLEGCYDCNVMPFRDYAATIVNGEFKPKFTADKVDYKSDWQCRYCDWRSECWAEVLKQTGKFHGERRIV